MSKKDKQYTIYIRSTKESVPVSKEEFDAYYHGINIYRIRQQRHGRCVSRKQAALLRYGLPDLSLPSHGRYAFP